MTVRCLLCLAESEHDDAVLHDMVDVRCPHCGTLLRLVAVPIGIEIVGRKPEEEPCVS